jgi:hypothetical protein
MDIAFVSVQERLDFTTVWGKLTLTVLGTLAEIYIDNLRQETRKGKLQRARDGLWNGNISYGYCKGLCSNCKEPNGAGYCPDFGQPDKSDGKHLILHPIDSKVVRLIYDWYLSDLESDGHIALRLLDHAITEDGLRARSRGLPGQKAGGPLQKESVRGILTNIFYAGMVPYYGMVQRGLPTTRRVKEAFPGKHPAIITKKEYDRVQEKRRTLGSTPLFHQPTQSRIYPLAGLLRCGYCGRIMRGSSGKDHYYYRDTTHIEKSGNCPQCTVRADAVEDQMIAWLNAALQNRLLDETPLSDDQQPIKIEERYNRVKELYISGQIEKDLYEAEKSKYENTIQTLRENDNTAIIALCKEMRCQLADWQQQAPIEKRRLLQLATEAVFIKGSVLVGVQPTFSLLPLTTMVDRVEVCIGGPDGIRTGGA